MTKARDNADGGASEFAELTDTTVSTSDPAVDSNPTSGLGHIWENKTSGEMYVLTDATADNNVWTNVGDGSGEIQTYTAPSATGGTVTTSGGYKYHKFTSSGNFVVSTAGSGIVDIMVVAGGGGGGKNRAGGGGAGGMRTITNVTITAQTYSIVVGAGGQFMASAQNSTNGSDSSGLGYTSLGGGRGGGNAFSPETGLGGSGGSGGGAGSTSGKTGGSGTSGQGNDGGDSNGSGAGGGGAGGVGEDSDGTMTDGGPGAVGYLGTYSQGGGGGESSDGQGINTNTPSVANSGNGGGGGSGSIAGSAGNSGIVIIRYLTA